jgi:hypothetical protein
LKKSDEKKVVNIASMLGDLGFSKSHPEFNFASYTVKETGVTIATLTFHFEYTKISVSEENGKLKVDRFKGEGCTFLVLNRKALNCYFFHESR